MLKNGLPGEGTLALIGGGEFSFGDTALVDGLWEERAEEGPVGFVPAASGSSEYAEHFATYLDAAFERRVEMLPIYRQRDARRGKNAARIGECAAVYIGGGIADQLIEAFTGSPALAALEDRLRTGGVIVAIAAAAQAFGAVTRSLRGDRMIEGFGWLDKTAIEANFDPAHDRRLRRLLEEPGIDRGLGLPAGSALFFRPGGDPSAVGPVLELQGPEADLTLARDIPQATVEMSETTSTDTPGSVSAATDSD